MTLKEAHEIQRRELMSLRAENKRLQKQTSGLFPVEEKESLERHIRHLPRSIGNSLSAAVMISKWKTWT